MWRLPMMGYCQDQQEITFLDEKNIIWKTRQDVFSNAIFLLRPCMGLICDYRYPLFDLITKTSPKTLNFFVVIGSGIFKFLLSKFNELNFHCHP